MRKTMTKILAVGLLALSATSVASAAATIDGLYLKHYDQQHLAQIALPIGGIGTGTVSLGGRGDLRDWEIGNRPAKGFNPGAPFFAIRGQASDGKTFVRALTGAVEAFQYGGPSGVKDATNPGLPTFRTCSFDAGYPFGRVNLGDPALPVRVRLRAFNPLVPTDPEASGIPIAVLAYDVENLGDRDLRITVCGTLQNFVGDDGVRALAAKNKNAFRRGAGLQGIFMTSDAVAKDAETWGTIALTTPASDGVTYRTAWSPQGWGTSLLDFWDDLTDDGQLKNGPANEKDDRPRASLAVQATVPAKGTRSFTFYVTWHFPNRVAWSTKPLVNYYSTRYADAWDAAEQTLPKLASLEKETAAFVGAFLKSDLPVVVKEAALFNLSTLRSQTCFRTADGRFYAWEGCGDKEGCCWGSCTHVWNYEQAVVFLFGTLARSLREIEFGPETDDTGLMSFRAKLPIDGPAWGKAAADGQMGCIMKMYRDWQLSGDRVMLAALWPKVRKALEFCWIKGGWDADKDGVMEGCQHNTMDVEYYGPNPQMGLWYLGALRAGEEMARGMGDADFAATCRSLFEKGSRWIDANLFNGRYYIQKVVPPMSKDAIAPSLLVGMGSTDFEHPDYQLGNGCLVDQLIGQLMARVCGLGDLIKPGNVRTTLDSIMKYNHRDSLADHFNCMRSFALGDEAALLMADYPDGRPANPFPYFTEVMTGFEYTAAIGMLYEGRTENGLRCIADIRNRYDGLKRSPYDEAECGHHYGRAMISWAAVLAMTGFHYSAVDQTLAFTQRDGVHFWSNGYAYGTLTQKRAGKTLTVMIETIKGRLTFKTFTATGFGKKEFSAVQTLEPGRPLTFEVAI
jgi:uncharacterized protein (DUF608 family)